MADDDEVKAEEHKYLGLCTKRRLFWVAFLSVLAAAALFNFVDRCLLLASRPVSTAVTSERVRPIDFPAVTVCNLNWVRASYLRELGILETVSDVLSFGSNSSAAECLSLQENAPRLLNVTLEELFGTGSQKNFVIDCKIFGEDCNDNIEPILTSIGLCYIFNRRGNIRANGTGIRLALHLFMDIDQDQYVTSRYSDAGIRAVVHPQSEPPLPIDRGISVPPGRNAFIGLQQRNIEDTTGRTCRKTSDPSGFNFLSDEYGYSAPACSLDCLLTKITENCGCLYLPQGHAPDSKSNQPPCGLQDLCCVHFNNDAAEDCVCDPACKQIIYDTFASYSSLPALNATERIGIPLEELQKDYVGVTVYFESLNVQSFTTSSSYTPVGLISDIGGILGLFLDLSIIAATGGAFWLYDERESIKRNLKIIAGWFRKGKTDASLENSLKEEEEKEVLTEKPGEINGKSTAV